MIIGCPKEIKDHEYRVGLTPAGAKRYIDAGHDILVESGAGDGSDISNDEYVEAGARILNDAQTVWQESEMINVQGVNVYPAAVRDTVAGLHPETTGAIEIQLHEAPPEGWKPPIHIKVEHGEGVTDDDPDVCNPISGGWSLRGILCKVY